MLVSLTGSTRHFSPFTDASTHNFGQRESRERGEITVQPIGSRNRMGLFYRCVNIARSR